MTQPKHTPGQWKVGKGAQGRLLLRGEDGGAIAQVLYGYYGDGATKANARLMAAAPDLLAACQTILPLLSQYAGTDADKAGLLALRQAIDLAVEER